MQVFDSLQSIASLALASLIPGVLLGIVLVITVTVALKSWAPMNAATRGIVWAMTLVALLLIPLLHFAGQLKSQAPAAKPALTTAGPVRAAAAPSVRSPEVKLPRPEVEQTPILPTPSKRWLELPVPQELPVIVLGSYLALVALLLLRLAISYLQVCRLRRRTVPPPASVEARLRHWLARCPTKRPVELRLCDISRSPLAIGFLRPMIVIPSALVLELSEEEFDDLGVHELAHIRRYDDWINLLQQILQALLFFHPAAHWAGRKLNFERELACDDWVVSAHGTKSYARCLTKVVALRGWQRGAILSSGAFFGKRQILKRVETLLDKRRNPGTGVSGLTVAAVLIALVAVGAEVIQLPAVVAVTQEIRGARSNARWTDDQRDLRVDMRGEVTFSADEQSITALPPWGYFDVQEVRGWSKRRLIVKPSPAGGLEEQYFVDGQRRTMDGVGRAWTASKYQFLMRELGLDAAGRVTRILARRGVGGVLDEVDLIQSDHVKAEYLTQLVERTTLATDDWLRVAVCVKKMSSDHEKAEFLLANAQQFTADRLLTSYFRAVDSINSDDDKRRVLMAALEADGRSPEMARLVGLSAKMMHSDHDKAEVLLAIPGSAPGETQCALLNAARTIQSDDDKARVLRDAAYAEPAECRDAFFAVVNLIQSDHDRWTVLQTLLARPGLDAQTYSNVAAAAKNMSSDNDKANVLALLGAHYSEAPFFDAVDTIQSENDRKRVLMTVLAGSPDKTVLLAIVDSTSRMSSEEDKTELLMASAKMSNDPSVREALQRACGKLTSDSDYRRLASVLLGATTESN